MRLADSDGRFELLRDMLRLRSSSLNRRRRRHSTATLRREEEYQLREVADVRVRGLRRGPIRAR